MKSVYRVLAFVVALEVAVQAAAIAFASAGLASWVAAGHTYDKAVMERDANGVTGAAGLLVHGVNGMVLVPLLGIALVVVAFRAGIPGGVTWAAAVLVTTVLQVGLGVLAESVPALGAVHGLLALLLFGLAVMAGKRVGSVTTVERRSAPL